MSKRNIVGIVFTGITSVIIMLLIYLLSITATPENGGLGRLAAIVEVIGLALPVLGLSCASICLCLRCKVFKYLPLASLGVLALTLGSGIGLYAISYSNEKRDLEIYSNYHSAVYDINYSGRSQVSYKNGEYTASFEDSNHIFYDVIKELKVDATSDKPLVYIFENMKTVEYSSLTGISVTISEFGVIRVERDVSLRFGRMKTYLQYYYFDNYLYFEAIYETAVQGAKINAISSSK